jgi:L-alanine-DL-glutamate epimerase-like enolase superfamily enzyme
MDSETATANSDAARSYSRAEAERFCQELHEFLHIPSIEEPAIPHGLRGMTYLKVEVRGPAKD